MKNGNNFYCNNVVYKPWGYEYVIYSSANRLAITFLKINSGHKTSLHCHPTKKTGFINNFSVGSIVSVIIFLELLVAIGGWRYKDTFVPLSFTMPSVEITNTHALGNVLYTDYIHLFQISGMILLVAMIGAIALTFSRRENVKRQNYFQQIQRQKNTAISLVEVESDKGVKIDD